MIASASAPPWASAAPVTESPSTDVAALLAPERIGPYDGAGKTVVVAMSGGVDSAVTALIMRERGYRVIGMNLRLFSPDDPEHSVNPCCGIPAMDDARATCALIGVPFYAINMETEFGRQSSTVRRRIRPGPHAESLSRMQPACEVPPSGATRPACSAPIAWRPGITPGSRHGENGEPHRLLRAVDPAQGPELRPLHDDQDQLGFIHLSTRQSDQAGGAPAARASSGCRWQRKKRARRSASSARDPMPTSSPSGVPMSPGPARSCDTTGEALGAHQGLVHHTVGQRRGLGIAAGEPLFVIRLEPDRNRLVVGSRDEAAARESCWSASASPAATGRRRRSRRGHVRYRGAPAAAVASREPRGAPRRACASPASVPSPPLARRWSSIAATRYWAAGRSRL